MMKDGQCRDLPAASRLEDRRERKRTPNTSHDMKPLATPPVRASEAVSGSGLKHALGILTFALDGDLISVRGTVRPKHLVVNLGRGHTIASSSEFKR